MTVRANIRNFGSGLLLLLATGCIKTELNTPTAVGGTDYDPSQVIAITTQVSALSGTAGSITRGTPIDNVSDMTSLGLFCSYTNQTQWSTIPTNNAPGYMFNEQLNLNASGFWEYAGTPVMWWGATYPSTVPTSGANAADHYTFFAYAPYETTGNGIAVTSLITDNGVPTLSYTVPTNVSDQPDLMVAAAMYDIHPTGHPVALQMKHALTAVGFTIVGNGEQVTGISISGVSTSGTLAMDGNAIAWTGLNAPQTTDFSASIAYDPDGSGGYLTYKTATSAASSLITGDGYLMMVPQTFDTTLRAPAPKPLMTISFADGTTRVIDMTNFPQWTPGERITYNIILTPAGTLSISPSDITMDVIAQTPSNQTVSVNAMNADGTDASSMPWTLTSSDPWLTLTLDPSGAGASQTLSGNGSQTVYLVTTENATKATRQATISLGTTGTVVTVEQPVFDFSLTRATALAPTNPTYADYIVAPNAWPQNGAAANPVIYMTDQIIVMSSTATGSIQYQTYTGAPPTAASAGWITPPNNSVTAGMPVDGALTLPVAGPNANYAVMINGVVHTITIGDIRDGTSTQPYLLAAGSTLSPLATSVPGIDFFTLASMQSPGAASYGAGFLTNSYELYENVDMSADAPGNWTPVGTWTSAATNYNGTFEGNAHTISNITINSTTGGTIGLFGQVGTTGVVQNLGLVGGSVTNNEVGNPSTTGAIAGSNSGLIQNCFNSGVNITVNAIAAGATLAGSGGIAGQSGGSIIGCCNTGNIAVTVNTGAAGNSNPAAGGIVGCGLGGGTNHSLIQDCYNTGTVSMTASIAATTYYAGGIIGRMQTTTNSVTRCYNTGNVTLTRTAASGTPYAGGIAGNLGAGAGVQVTYCYALNTTVTSAAGTPGRVADLTSASTKNNNYAYDQMLVNGALATPAGQITLTGNHGASITAADATNPAAPTHFATIWSGVWGSVWRMKTGADGGATANLPILVNIDPSIQSPNM